MASTAQQNSGFVDNFDYVNNYGQWSRDMNSLGLGKGGFVSKIDQFFGFGSENEHVQRQLEDDRAYERASINSARAWDEYMDSTQIQRRVKDLEAAGLNPWLAIQNGVSGSGATSADTGGSARHHSNSGQSKSNLAMLLLALAKIIK